MRVFILTEWSLKVDQVNSIVEVTTIIIERKQISSRR